MQDYFDFFLSGGAALGYILGGFLGQQLGWRVAFLFCGIPGLFVAWLVTKIKEPERGYFDNEKPVVTPWKDV